MSWQTYVDTNLVGTGKISQAAIIGVKGGVWATSAGFALSQKEQTDLITGFDAPDNLQANGIHIAGKKYFTLQANPRSIYGKSQADGVVCVKTNQAVLVCVYNSPILPGAATKVAESLADYLLNAGY